MGFFTDFCRCCFPSLICILLAFGTLASWPFYTCLALDVDVCFASFGFPLISALFCSLGFCLRICVKVILIKWMEIYFTFLFSSYAALFLSRDSGCKNTLIWVWLFCTQTPSYCAESSCGALWWYVGGRAPNWPTIYVRICLKLLLQCISKDFFFFQSFDIGHNKVGSRF